MTKLRFDNAIWSLPLLFSEDIFAISFLDTLKYAKLDYKFELYGCPVCAWNAGITSFLSSNDIGFFERTLELFRLKNVVPVISFTKHNLNNIDLEDKFCNDLLELAMNYESNFVISSDKLYKHIKKKFPTAYCISSPTKPIFDTDKDKEFSYYQNLLKSYDRVILRPEFVKNFKGFIEGISDLSRVEIVVNSTCLPYCKNAKEEIKYFESLTISDEPKEYRCVKDYCYPLNLNLPLFMSNDEIKYFYNMGVRHFRILPTMLEKNVSDTILFDICNYIFDDNTNKSLIFNNALKNLESVNDFYSSEIIKNSKIQNIRHQRNLF
ncbi:MAG: hypothetical protein DKM22_00480 [Candidatus Melainabacteria bacterium]|nr:MAG: hypothetical protein DKM22_00480 [Candidatus Melainabacteria bacterium]